MDIKNKFLMEIASGSVSDDTLALLAEELKTKKPQGRPPKIQRDMRAAAWFRVATERAGWNNGDAYQQLAKDLCTDERNARKIVAKASATDRIHIIYGSETHFIVVDIIRKFRSLPFAAALFNGRIHRTYQKVTAKEGKDAFFYLFEKSKL